MLYAFSHMGMVVQAEQELRQLLQVAEAQAYPTVGRAQRRPPRPIPPLAPEREQKGAGAWLV